MKLEEKLKVARETLVWISMGPYYDETPEEAVVSMMKDASIALDKIGLRNEN